MNSGVGKAANDPVVSLISQETKEAFERASELEQLRRARVKQSGFKCGLRRVQTMNLDAAVSTNSC